MYKLQLNYDFHRLVIRNSIQSILNNPDNEQLQKFFRFEKCISKNRQKKKNLVLDKVRDSKSAEFELLGAKAALYLAEIFTAGDQRNLLELSKVLTYCSGMSGFTHSEPNLRIVIDHEIGDEPESWIAYGIAAVIYDEVAGATLLQAFDPDWNERTDRSIDLDRMISLLKHVRINVTRALNYVSIYLQANIARLSLYKPQPDSSRHGPARCLSM